MENKSTLGHILIFGLSTGVIMVIFSLLFYLFNVDQKSYINSLIYIILILGMTWGIINIRQRRLNNVISYGKSFGIGFWIGFVASIVIAIYTYFYLTKLNPGYMEKVLSETENKILESNPDISDEQLDTALSAVKMFGKPYISAFMQIVSNSIAAVIFSLIISIFAKREDKTIA